jgi:stage II sporulation protein D
LATTAARLLLVAGVVVGAGSCVPANVPTPPAPAAPVAVEPEVRIGVAVRAAAVTIGGTEALVLSEPDGSTVARVPAGERWRIVPSGSGVSVRTAAGPSMGPYDALAVAPATAEDPVRVEGKPYRGIVELLRDADGVTAVDRLPIEQYLLGVVSAEMGRRSADEFEALKAQAVVSRTYAMRNLGRWRTQGFDLYATVSDQVFGGIGAETPEGAAAVEATRGQVVTYGGVPIDAFFYSTCGGRTADGTEVFRDADRPYLHSVSDVGSDGLAYCRISPRYQWREEWSGADLLATLRRTLPAVLGMARARASEVRDLRIVARTGSGRVEQLALGFARSEVQVPSRQIRQVLRAPSGDILRSTAFTLAVHHTGKRIRQVVAEGNGAGHGVGMCQWGAVGRSRAGQRYDQIIAAYYQGTTVERLF